MPRKNQYDSQITKNKARRYRLPEKTARLLGLKPNKTGMYRVNLEQERRLLGLDQQPINRLFFDIETTPYLVYSWRLRNVNYIPYEMVKEQQKIICISYKWEGKDEIHRINWSKGCDKKLIEEFLPVMKEADEIVAHNGDRYDIKKLRTRAIYHRIPMLPQYKTLDTLKKSRFHFSFPSNRLDDIAQFLEVSPKVKHEGFSMWAKVMQGDKKALNDMGNYCDGDIVTLEDVYFALEKYIKHNTHVGRLNGGWQWTCASCGSERVEYFKPDFTATGYIKRLMECGVCGFNYQISNSAYRGYLEHKQKEFIKSLK